MFKNLDMFRTSLAMAQHAGARQALVATNIANADTPGYRARSIAAFAETDQVSRPAGMHATRPGHIQPDRESTIVRTQLSDNEPSPNGNTVSIEAEMLRAVDIEREHNRALTIYRHSLTVLRTSLGR